MRAKFILLLGLTRTVAQNACGEPDRANALFDQSVGRGPVQPDSGYNLHVVDDGYLSSTGYALQPRAAGYPSDSAVWDAIRNNTGYAVVNASSLDKRSSGVSDIVGIKPTDSTFQPFKIRLQTVDKTGTSGTWTVTVVGFMKSTVLWGGVYVSTRTAMESGLFTATSSAGPASSTQPATTLNPAQQPLVPTGYYFSLKPGVDVNKARLDLGRMLDVPAPLRRIILRTFTQLIRPPRSAY